MQNEMPGLAAPDPAFTTIVVPRSSLDVAMVEFVCKSLLGSAALDIEIHRWSCRLRVSPDGRWSKTGAVFQKVAYCFIDPSPSTIDSYFQFGSDIHDMSTAPAPPISHTRVVCRIVEW